MNSLPLSESMPKSLKGSACSISCMALRTAIWLLPIRARLSTTTVSLTLFPYVAARTSIQFSDDVASEHEAQGGDGIGHVTLRALDCRAGCNFGVGKVFLIE